MNTSPEDRSMDQVLDEVLETGSHFLRRGVKWTEELAYSSGFGDTAEEMNWSIRRSAEKISLSEAAKYSDLARAASGHLVLRTLVVTALLLSCLSLRGAVQYNLTLRLEPGLTWNFEQDVEAEQKTYRTVNTETLPDLDQQVRSSRRGTITVLAVASGVPTAVRVVFDATCGTRITQTGKPEQQIPYPLAGSTATLRRGIGGRVVQEVDPEPKNELDPAVRADLQAYLEGNEGRPTHPLALGEIWMPTAAQLSNTFRLVDPTDVGVSQFRLANVLATNGMRLAHVVVSNYSKIHPGQMVISEQVTGSLWYDLETGRLVQTSLDDISGTQGYQMMADPTGQQTLANVQKTGKSRIWLFTSVRGTPAPMAGLAAPQTEASGGFGRAGPPVGAASSGGTLPVSPTPLSTAPPASSASPPAEAAPATATPPPTDPWPGTYQDTGLTIQIVGKGVGLYEGTITLEGRGTFAQKFPLTAQGDAHQIAGHFQSGPDSFEFSATLDGRTMNFVTDETNRYQLLRRAVNPLARPATTSPPAANPLTAAGSRGSGAVPTVQTNRPPAAPVKR
jgi:hypothetical protein